MIIVGAVLKFASNYLLSDKNLDAIDSSLYGIAQK